MSAFYDPSDPHPGKEVVVTSSGPTGKGWFKTRNDDHVIIKVKRTVMVSAVSTHEKTGENEEEGLGRVRSLQMGQSAATSRLFDYDVEDERTDEDMSRWKAPGEGSSGYIMNATKAHARG